MAFTPPPPPPSLPHSRAKAIYKASSESSNQLYLFGIVTIFTLVKLNKGFMIEKLSISRPSLKMTTRQPLLAMPTPLDTTLSGIILIS